MTSTPVLLYLRTVLQVVQVPLRVRGSNMDWLVSSVPPTVVESQRHWILAS